MLVTVITIWSLLLLGNALLTQPIPAHSASAFMLFSPWPMHGWTSWFLVMLWLLWLIAALTLAVNAFITSRSSRPIHRNSQMRLFLSLGIVGNMRRLDTVLIGIALVLAILGWLTGTTPLFFLGSVIVPGLLLNRIEQRFI